MGLFDKAKLQMFNPLFAKIPGAEKEREATALGLSHLTGSKAVLEWLLLAQIQQQKLLGMASPRCSATRAHDKQERQPWRANLLEILRYFAPEQVIYLTAVINRDLEIVHWVKHAGHSWRQRSLLPDMPASTRPAAFPVGDGAHVAPPQAETHPS